VAGELPGQQSVNGQWARTMMGAHGEGCGGPMIATGRRGTCMAVSRGGPCVSAVPSTHYVVMDVFLVWDLC
jgi:hypothetical protein